MESQVTTSDWVRIEHPMVPDEPEYMRAFIRKFMAAFGHCMDCTSLSGCYFKEQVHPEIPYHENCHCEIKASSPQTIKAECSSRKFTHYAFKGAGEDNGKKNGFEQLGFSYYDSDELVKEYERQAIEKYNSGEYVLHKHNLYGQRINIVI